MDELIRKKDALDALMAERKHLLDKGRWGAEHVLTHHGYNVIDELPTVQSDVPVINVGDMIYRQAATTIPVMPKEHRHYQTNNLDDAYEQGWNDLQECIENLPPVQPETATVTIGRTRGETTMWYECDACGEPVDVNDNYCRNCGRKLIHD